MKKTSDDFTTYISLKNTQLNSDYHLIENLTVLFKKIYPLQIVILYS